MKPVTNKLLNWVIGFIFVISLILPYFWFGLNLSLGGDQGNFYLMRPDLFFKNLSLNNWYPVGVGFFNPSYFTSPLMYVLGLFKNIPQPIFLLHHLIYSLVFFFSFYLFFKTLNRLFELPDWLKVVLALLYATSPISAFIIYEIPLYTIFTVPLVNFLIYKLIDILTKKNGSKLSFFLDYLSVAIAVFFFSVGLFQVPWVVPFGVIVLFLYLILLLQEKTTVAKILIHSFLFLGVSLFSSLFWIIPLISQFLRSEDSLAKGFFAETDVVDTFTPTVQTLSQFTNPINPFINLEQYELYRNFGTPRFDLYENYLLEIAPINYLIIFFLFLAILVIAVKHKTKRSIVFLICLVQFTILAFSYTVNVPDPFFKRFFLFLGTSLPGFYIFRNFIGKFSISTAFALFLVLTASLQVIYADLFHKEFKFSLARKFIFRNILIFSIIVLFVANIIPFLAGGYVKTHIWRSQNVSRVIPDLNPDYYALTDYISANVPNTFKIMNLTLNHAGYDVILGSQKNSKNVFVGNSPLPILTGHNHLVSTKSLSVFRKYFNEMIQNKRYEEVAIFLDMVGVKYVIENKNRPKTLDYSWFEERWLTDSLQSAEFKEQILDEAVYSNDSYNLYKTKHFEQPLIKSYGEIFSLPSFTPDEALSLKKVLGENSLILNKETLSNLSYAGKASEIDVIKPQKDSNFVLKNTVLNVLADNFYQLKLEQTEQNISFLRTEELNLISDSGLQLNIPFYEDEKLEFPVEPNFGGIKINDEFYSKLSFPLDVSVVKNHQYTVYNYTDQEFTKSLQPRDNQVLDCNRYEDKSDTAFFDYNQEENVLQLKALNYHNACLYNDHEIENDEVKFVSFEFDVKNNTATDFGVEFFDENKEKIDVKNLKIEPNENFENQGFIVPITQENIKYIRYYFRSGQSSMAEASYKNFVVKYLEKEEQGDINFDKKYKLKLQNDSAVTTIGSSFQFNQDYFTDLGIQKADWIKADCQRIDEAEATQIRDSGSGFVLNSKDKHAACIRVRKELVPNQNIRLDFTAQNIQNAPELLIYISYKDGSHSKELVKLDDSKKNHSVIINTPVLSKEGVIHLVAVPKPEENTISLENIQVLQLPKFLNSLYSLEENLQGTVLDLTVRNDQIKYSKADEAYNIKLPQDPIETKFISIPQLYDTGWKVSNTDQTPIDGFGLINVYDTAKIESKNLEIQFKFDIFGIRFKGIFYVYLFVHFAFVVIYAAFKLWLYFKPKGELLYQKQL